MRLWMKTNAGEAEIMHERRPPMELERFKAVCLLIGFALWCATVCGVTVLGDFWHLVWLLSVTVILVIACILRGIDIF